MSTKVKMASAFVVLAVTVLLLNNTNIFDNFLGPTNEVATPANGEDALIEVQKISQPTTRFGLPLDSFEVVDKVVAYGESFSNILLNFGVEYATIHKIANDFEDVFDVRTLRTGKPYALFCQASDTNQVARYMVYQPSPINYYVFNLQDSVSVYKGEKEVTTRTKSISGSIQSSLYETIAEAGGSPALTMELSTIYAWSIDFFRIKKDDYFKVIYEEKYIDDTVNVGIGRVIACDFNHGSRSFYSFWFKADSLNYSDYFDEEGKTLRKAFLKAPLNYSRISSRYSPRRFHPVLKRYKSHLGTDYAAPRGTPIMATADGEVIAAAYTGGNGNYVKIKHNRVYTTQYLHMTKFGAGIRKGKVVKQGDVIGYVGSTGLATGPHVCYRFWVNGKQVDPYQQDLPDAEPIKEEYKEGYMQIMAQLKKRLDALEIKEAKDEKVHYASAG
jgi:murein DD-endopeptidase MepM/ murein hydrolase activator NlpD